MKPISLQRIQGPRGLTNNISTPPIQGENSDVDIQQCELPTSHQALVARALAALVDHGRRGRPEARFAAITKWVQGPYMNEWKSHYDVIR